MNHRLRGLTLFETVTAMAVMAVVSGVLLQIFTGMFSAQRFTMEAPSVQAEATDLALDAAALVRRAPLCRTSAGCGGVDATALAAGTATGFVVYTSPAGATRTVGSTGAVGGSTGGPVAVPVGGTAAGSGTIACSYLVNPSASYSFLSEPANATWVSSVSAAELPRLQAVRIIATVSRGGLTATSRAEARFRNSPLKRRSTD